MNETLISGLLGAVMGGTSSIEKSLAEEEAARRKEEEEKRREERILSIEERKRASAEAMKAAQEKARMERIASYLPAATGATPSQSPMEPEGGGVTEFQVPTEQRLIRAAEAATAKGDVEAAKIFSDQYRAMMQEQRAQAEEARKQEQFGKEKPEKATEATRSFEANVLAAYTGPKDAEGNPLDPEDFNKFRARAASARLFGRERPEGPVGEKPLTKTDTLRLEGALRGSLKDRSRVQEKPGEAPVFKEGVYSDLVTIANKIKKADPDLIRAPDVVADEAYRQYQNFSESARSSAKAEWTRLNTPIKDDKEAEKKRRKDLESLKTSERISSERTYIEKKSPQILRGLIGVGQQKEKEEFDPNDPLGFFKK